MVRKDLEILSHDVKITGRLINFKFRHNSENTVYNFSAFYGHQFRRINVCDLSSAFKPLFDCHSRSDNNVIIGDFNFIDNDLYKGQGMDNNDKKISSLWEDFKRKTVLSDPFREQNPTTKRYSFHTKNGKSRIDRIYVNTVNVFNVKNINYQFYSKANAHKLMTFSLKKSDEKGPGYWKLNTSVINDVPYVNLITECINKVKQTKTNNPSEWWELLLFNVRNHTRWYTEQKNIEKLCLKPR